jgi:hypothetical protein
MNLTDRREPAAEELLLTRSCSQLARTRSAPSAQPWLLLRRRGVRVWRSATSVSTSSSVRSQRHGITSRQVPNDYRRYRSELCCYRYAKTYHLWGSNRIRTGQWVRPYQYRLR